MTIKHTLLIIAISLLTLLGCQDSTTQNNNEGKSVGFQLIEEQDYTRTVTGGSSPSKTYPRPIRTYLWYPARKSNDAQPMHFGQYAKLADEDIWPSQIVGNLHQDFKYLNRALARSLDSERLEALLNQPVLAIENAKALKGPFPLIVIGQGLYYESTVAFAAMSEYLAKQGFVVATCPLVGTNSPIVRLDVQGLETQIRDLEFVIARARHFSFVSQDKLGVLGFDMGGMAGLILTMRNADVDAFVSISSGILYPHPSGIPMSSPHYDPLTLRVPWLHSVPTWWLPQGQDSLAGSLFESAIHSNRYLLLTEGMGHVDYTSYALIEGRNEMKGYWASANPEAIKGYKAICRYISNFFYAFLEKDQESLMMFSQDPEEYISGTTWSIEHRPAVPSFITYEEFVQAVLAGQADDAIEKVRALRETHPNHILLNETYLQRIVWSLRDTWGLSEKVMPVIKFRVELYPMSVSAQRMLAEGYIDIGDYPAAIKVYNNLLERNPEDNSSQSRLEWLLNQ